MEGIPSQVVQYTDQSLSAIHHALRVSRRRLVIGLMGYRVLSPNRDSQSTDIIRTHSSYWEEGIDARQLAREITSIEANVSIDHATGAQYHSVYNTLTQTHLPELDDLGMIEYDEDRKWVYPDRNFVAIAMVAAITSPVAQTLFHTAVSDHNLGGPESS